MMTPKGQHTALSPKPLPLYVKILAAALNTLSENKLSIYKAEHDHEHMCPFYVGAPHPPEFSYLIVSGCWLTTRG